MQYASTFPSSTSRTASGPFSNRGSVPPAGVFAGAAFFAAGRRDVDDVLVVLAGRVSAAGAAAATGPGAGVWVLSVSVMAAASEAGPVDRVGASAGAGAPVNVAGTGAPGSSGAG